MDDHLEKIWSAVPKIVVFPDTKVFLKGNRLKLCRFKIIRQLLATSILIFYSHLVTSHGPMSWQGLRCIKSGLLKL